MVNDVITQLDPDRAVTFTYIERATEHLGAILAKGPRRLLILDDVWSREQLEVFLATGQSARLVTTRNQALVIGSSLTKPHRGLACRADRPRGGLTSLLISA